MNVGEAYPRDIEPDENLPVSRLGNRDVFNGDPEVGADVVGTGSLARGRNLDLSTTLF